MNSLEEKK